MVAQRQGAHVTLSLTALRGLTYTTKPDANGSDTLTWTVTDDGTTNGAADPQTLTENLPITVTARLHPWQNTGDVYDVDDDSNVTPTDVLLVIYYIDTYGSGPISASVGQPRFVDVNGDDFVTALDVLLVINYINLVSFAGNGGEGEAVSAVLVGSPSPLPATEQPNDDFGIYAIASHPATRIGVPGRGSYVAARPDIVGQLAYRISVADYKPMSAVVHGPTAPPLISASAGVPRIPQGRLLDGIRSPRYEELEALLDLLA